MPAEQKILARRDAMHDVSTKNGKNIKPVTPCQLEVFSAAPRLNQGGDKGVVLLKKGH
jgi:hypothetical protein